VTATNNINLTVHVLSVWPVQAILGYYRRSMNSCIWCAADEKSSTTCSKCKESNGRSWLHGNHNAYPVIVLTTGREKEANSAYVSTRWYPHPAAYMPVALACKIKLSFPELPHNGETHE